MRVKPLVGAVLALLLPACGHDAGSAQPVAATPVSSWRFVSLEVDGEPYVIDEPLFLDITEQGFQAATTCNTISGQFRGEQQMTAMLCGPQSRMVGERYIGQALQAEPTEQGGQLIFDDGHVRLVYEAFVDPLLTDLFSVLGDPNASVDESMLPSEQATGTVPPDFEALVPIPSPTSEIDLFLADFDGNPCLVYGTAHTMDKFCNPLRTAAEISPVTDIPIYQQPIMRVALIPDRFGTAVAARPDLGSYESNVLIVHPDVPPGHQTLTDDQGNTFTLVVPPPWTDPMAASRTVPDV